MTEYKDSISREMISFGGELNATSRETLEIYKVGAGQGVTCVTGRMAFSIASSHLEGNEWSESCRCLMCMLSTRCSEGSHLFISWLEVAQKKNTREPA